MKSGALRAWRWLTEGITPRLRRLDRPGRSDRNVRAVQRAPAVRYHGGRRHRNDAAAQPLVRHPAVRPYIFTGQRLLPAGVPVPRNEFHPPVGGVHAVCLGVVLGVGGSSRRVLPDLTGVPVIPAVAGGLFVGVGVGIIVRQGGSSGGDDALALVISRTSAGGSRGRTCSPILRCWACR